MYVYLIRHGDALAHFEDPRRPLSPRGQAQAGDLGARLAARGLRPVRVLHSPKARAEQTAAVVAAAAFPVAPRAVGPGLLPMDPVEVWRDRLEEAPDEDLVLVGHNPFMGELASRLSGVGVRFETATVACLARRGGYRWNLEWLDRGRAD